MSELRAHPLAAGNVLFLRGDLEIRPPDREEVSFEYLVERLGDYLLSHGPASNDKVKKQDRFIFDSKH